MAPCEVLRPDIPAPWPKHSQIEQDLRLPLAVAATAVDDVLREHVVHAVVTGALEISERFESLAAQFQRIEARPLS